MNVNYFQDKSALSTSISSLTHPQSVSFSILPLESAPMADPKMIVNFARIQQGCKNPIPVTNGDNPDATSYPFDPATICSRVGGGWNAADADEMKPGFEGRCCQAEPDCPPLAGITYQTQGLNVSKFVNVASCYNKPQCDYVCMYPRKQLLEKGSEAIRAARDEFGPTDPTYLDLLNDFCTSNPNDALCADLVSARQMGLTIRNNVEIPNEASTTIVQQGIPAIWIVVIIAIVLLLIWFIRCRS